MLNVDRLRAEQAVGNLVDNALRHGRGGSSSRRCGAEMPRSSSTSVTQDRALPRTSWPGVRAVQPRGCRAHRRRAPGSASPLSTSSPAPTAAPPTSRAPTPGSSCRASLRPFSVLARYGSAHGRATRYAARFPVQARRRGHRGRPRLEGRGSERGRARGGGLRSRLLRADARADGRPVLPARRQGAAQRHRGQAGRAADAEADGASTSRRASRSRAPRSTSGIATPIGTYAAATHKTFLRGIQKTDAKGVATFKTIYPGWYQGRTVHIHVKVSLGGNVVHTGQLYFPRLHHRQGLHAVAVQIAAGTYDAQPRRLDLSQRRQPLDAEAEEGGERLHGLDHHGRPEIGRKSGDFRPRGGLRQP